MMGDLWENVSEAARCRNTPRPLIHSLDLTKEGLGMKPTRNCSVDGCDSPLTPRGRRGMCLSHYKKFRRSDEFEPISSRSVEDRVKSRLIETVNGCQEWPGDPDRPRDYGRIMVGGKILRAHRLAWEFANGPIPDGLLVLHRCDNPPCCNPAHLFVGTDADNMADMMQKDRLRLGNRATMHHVQARKTHCPQGHAYSLENTYMSPSGKRHCRTCAKANHQRQQQKRRAAKRRAVA